MTHVLGIETSCDETAAAVVRGDGRVLSSVVSSQVDLHRPLGGVVPEIASRAHMRLLVPAIRRALEEAGIGLGDVDGIAVTRGPGLIGALLVGVQASKSLAYAIDRPVVGVHHLQGHMAAPFLVDETTGPPPPYPFVALVASGGHTSLVEALGPSEFRLIGRTRDDAAGEALDKGAKLLGLGYPGGPEIEREARAYDGPDTEPFPRGLRRRDVLDFSFSGLKTALAERVRGLELDEATRGALCRAYEEAVVDSLATKSLAACRATGLRSLVVCGGVAANARLRSELGLRAADGGVEVSVPPPRYCTDNAAMIAMAGMGRLEAGENEVFELAAAAWLPVPLGVS